MHQSTTTTKSGNKKEEERVIGLMMMMLHFKVIMTTTYLQHLVSFVVERKKEVGALVIFVEVQIGEMVEIIKTVVQEGMIIDVAIMLLLLMVINKNNNEGGEKAEDEAMDVEEEEKEEDGEAMTVENGGTMILRHDVDPSMIEKNLTQAGVGGKEGAVLVEVALAVPPPQIPITTWQLQWVRLIYVQLNMQDMNMFMALHLY
jgi:hypothetical protein